MIIKKIVDEIDVTADFDSIIMYMRLWIQGHFSQYE